MTPLDRVKDIGPGHDVVRTASHRTHAADELVAFQKSLVFLRGELTAPIRVQELPGCSHVAATRPSPPLGPLAVGHDEDSSASSRRYRPGRHTADESTAVTGRSPGRGHSADTLSNPSTR